MACTWWRSEGSFEAALMRAARPVSKPEHTQMERSLVNELFTEPQALSDSRFAMSNCSRNLLHGYV